MSEHRSPVDDDPRDPSDETPDEDQPRLVYRRVEPVAEAVQPHAAAAAFRQVLTRELAPAIMPLVIGFLLLLGLISLLGYFSVNRMDEVSSAISGLEQQHAARLGLLLKFRMALTQLDNEARARSDAEARGGIKPPFAARLITARGETNQLLMQLDRPPLGSDPASQSFKNNLQSYVEVTEDLRRYSLEGYSKFKVADDELNAMLTRASEDQAAIANESERIKQDAARSIRTWSIVALFVGALVAAGTIWEVQRRFAEMRRSMHEARRERVFTSQLLEGMVSAVCAIDENDRIRSANAAFFNIYPGATIGASVYERFGSEPAMKMLEAATATRVDVSSYRGRFMCSSDNAHEKAFDIYSSPLAIDEARGQIVTLVDVTEAAEAERGLRRQESLAAVGQATAQVAHEIRNPLGSIRLGVAMLRDNVNDADGLRTIELVERGIKHLNKLVVDVAQFSRRKALERADVDLHELIGRSLELVTDKISEKETEIQKRFSEERLVGHWDPDQLRQVLVNVVGNAIDASPRQAPVTIGTEVVNVATGEDLAPTRHARVTVTDVGKGIDEPTLARIFEPFFSTKKRGTGLGLAIVKQIVEQHGGNISVQSEPDKGASFMIDLPL